MKFGRHYLNEQKIVSYFAFLPVTIKGETRWLEKVTILKEWYGYFEGLSQRSWHNIKFIDKEQKICQ